MGHDVHSATLRYQRRGASRAAFHESCAAGSVAPASVGALRERPSDRSRAAARISAVVDGNTSRALLIAGFTILASLAMLVALAGCGASAASVNTAATATENATVAAQVDTLGRQSAESYSQQVQSKYDPGQRDATVTVTVGWTNDIHAADVAKEQERVKTICFVVQQALWTANLPLHQLTVTVLGPVTTGYTQQDNDAHGAARVTGPTAAKLNWASLAPDTAWNLYDEAYLRADYDPPVVAVPGDAWV